MCSPQGRPLIFQAGQSGRGMRFAADHADAIYALHPRLDSMKKFMTDVRAARTNAGKPGDPKVFFGLQPILGGTEEEARKILARLQRRPKETERAAVVKYITTAAKPDAAVEDAIWVLLNSSEFRFNH